MNEWIKTGSVWTHLPTGQQSHVIPPELAQAQREAPASLQSLRDFLYQLDQRQIACTMSVARQHLGKDYTWEDVSCCAALEREQMHLVSESGKVTSHWLYRRFADYVAWTEGGDFARSAEELRQLLEEKAVLETRARKKKVEIDTERALVLTASTVDHACAAAVALLAVPHAEVWISSSETIGVSLRSALSAPTLPGHILVCGIVPSCPYEHFASELEQIAEHGIVIDWILSGQQKELVSVGILHARFLETLTVRKPQK